MTKNKKAIASIVGILAGIGVIGGILYTPVNNAENEYVLIESSIEGIKNNALESKQELLDMQNIMVKFNKDNENTINIDKAIEEIEKDDYSDSSKLNEYVKKLDSFNKEIDNMIDIYNKDENMKKDIKITQSMMDIEGTNNLTDSIMNEYNKEHAPKFNSDIKKFPINIIAKIKGWFEVDKFSSID